MDIEKKQRTIVVWIENIYTRSQDNLAWEGKIERIKENKKHNGELKRVAQPWTGELNRSGVKDRQSGSWTSDTVTTWWLRLLSFFLFNGLQKWKLYICGPLCAERVVLFRKITKESWYVVLYFSKLRSKSQGRNNTRNDCRVFLSVLESTWGAGITQVTAHSCVHAPAYSTVYTTRGIHFSFLYRWLCFISLIKDFYQMTSGFFTPVVWMES